MTPAMWYLEKDKIVNITINSYEEFGDEGGASMWRGDLCEFGDEVIIHDSIIIGTWLTFVKFHTNVYSIKYNLIKAVIFRWQINIKS